MKRLLLLLALCLLPVRTLAENAVQDAAILVEGAAFGPGVSKLVLTLEGTVAEVSRVNAAITTGGVRRTAADAYPCDEWGWRTAAPSACVAIELDDRGMKQCSPLVKAGDQGKKAWAASYPVSVHGMLVLDGEACAIQLEEDLIGRRICPDAERFSVRLSHTAQGRTIQMAAYEPEQLSGGGKNPLIVWLHGGDEGGTELDAALLGNWATTLAQETIQNHFSSADGCTGAYVLIPQCPTYWMDEGTGETGSGAGWSVYVQPLMEAIEAYLRHNPDADPARIYLGGCSNGGYMTMQLLLAYPDAFAAAFPVCEALRHQDSMGDGASILDGDGLEALSYQSIWFVHAMDDNVVPPSTTVLPTYRDLTFLAAEDCHLSLFTGCGHAVWNMVYQDRVRGVQAPEMIAEENRPAPDENGGPADAIGFFNLFAWLNAHALGDE